MSNQLYIIGNGFDLAHGLPTRYQNYHQYLMDNNELWMCNMLEFFFGNELKVTENLLWSDLERALGIYDVEDIYDFLQEGHTLDLDHIGQSTGELEAEVEYHFVKICEKFNETFTEWCKSIDLSKTKRIDSLGISGNGTFLTFNYSDTLESVYGIGDPQVLHIHGRASKDDELIVGHNKHASMPTDIKEDFYDHEANYNAIVDTINRLEKKTGKIISNNRRFFDGLNTIEKIIVIGHSIADVDMPYFEEVNKNVNADSKWRFSYHNKEEIGHIDNVAKRLGISSNNYQLFEL